MNDNFEEMKITAEEIEKASISPTQEKEPHMQWRLEALKIAKDIALSTAIFDQTYNPKLGGGGKDKFDIHLQQLWEIADCNLKYILGEK